MDNSYRHREQDLFGANKDYADDLQYAFNRYARNAQLDSLRRTISQPSIADRSDPYEPPSVRAMRVERELNSPPPLDWNIPPPVLIKTRAGESV
jgi:hypothetical protein